MNKLKKLIKKLSFILIVSVTMLTTLESTFAPYEIYADTTTTTTTTDQAKSEQDLLTKTGSAIGTAGDFLVGLALYIPKAMAMGLASLLRVLVYGITSIGSSGDGIGSVDAIIFNEAEITSIDFFDTSSNGTVNKIRENISIWYYVFRNLSIVILLGILLYVGIRMAISTVASEQAKYKKMLISWVTSFILLFVMQYIFIFLLGLQESLLEIVATWANGKGFEEQIVESILATILSASGFNIIAAAIEYCMLVYYQVKFFLLYFKRFLEVGFLLVISPLVTITYPIDKIGDGKAQAYSAWFTRIVYNMFLQLIHATVYIIFIYSAGEIAKKAPILGILFLTTLSRIEKIIRATFGLRGQGLSDEKLLDKIKRG